MSGEEAVGQGRGSHGFRAFCQLPTGYNLRTLHLSAFARSHAVENAFAVAFAAAQWVNPFAVGAVVHGDGVAGQRQLRSVVYGAERTIGEAFSGIVAVGRYVIYSTARALAEHNASIVKRCFIGFMSLFLNLACRKVKHNMSYFSCTILLFGMTIFRKQTHQQRLPLFPIATGSATAPRLMSLGFIGYPHVAGIAALAVNVRLLKL